METEKLDYSTISYSPQETSHLSLDMVRKLRDEKDTGVKTGIDDLDKIMLPMRAGELITVLGGTSNYKSGFMNWLSKQAIAGIKPESNEIVIRVTWEQSVEEDTISWLAGATDISITKLARGEIGESEWKQLEGAAVKRALTPMWIVGHSQLKSEERRKSRPRMTMPDVSNAIEFILNDATVSTLQPKMIVLDYLQRIRPAKEDGYNKREQMVEAVNHAKDMAISFGCPVVLGVQVTRDISERKVKIPSISDGQETSNIEQSSDKMLSLWYPCKSEPLGTMIVDGMEVTENLLFVKILKQKMGQSHKTFALYIDPEKNIIKGKADLTTAL